MRFCPRKAYLEGLTPLVPTNKGDPNGYLHTLGFKDFGGSGVIHLFAGTCALLANWLCGPRVNRFGRGSRHAVELSAPMAFIAKKLGGGRRMYGLLHVLSGHIDLELVVREVPGHSPALAGLGTVVVAVAWIPLNCMNGMTTDITSGGALASKAAVNTLLAGNAAVMSAVLWSVLVRQENDVNLVARALMAGLVAVSGPCAYLSAWAAIVVGMFALCVLLACDTLVTRALKVDDPLSIVSVHAACGVLGLLWLGLADQTDGLFVSGDAHLLGVEMLGCLCIMACGVAAAAPFIVARAMLHDGIAYPQDEQLMGLDFIYFTGTAYPDLDLEFVGTAPPSRRASTADKKVGTDLVQALESSVHSVTGGFFKRPVSHAQSEGSVHGAPSVTPVASSTQLLPPKQPTNFANDALDVILADDLLRKRLRQFLSANHMDENVRFMDSVAARYNDPVESFRVSSARAIVLMFIEEKSPKQINLAADVRREIIKAYRQSNSAELGKREFFDRALKELYHDLRQNPAFKQCVVCAARPMATDAACVRFPRFVVQVFGGIGSGGIL